MPEKIQIQKMFAFKIYFLIPVSVVGFHWCTTDWFPVCWLVGWSTILLIGEIHFREAILESGKKMRSGKWGKNGIMVHELLAPPPPPEESAVADSQIAEQAFFKDRGGPAETHPGGIGGNPPLRGGSQGTQKKGVQ